MKQIEAINIFSERLKSYLKRSKIKQVYLDRPFVYMIVDWENKVPFFVGTMMDPGK